MTDILEKIMEEMARIREEDAKRQEEMGKDKKEEKLRDLVEDKE